ncbi:tyrosine-type recombinase/integrase [Bdellovibrio sp. BCCA]|uniref:tyrosine-type recombinase/integrase n=1 Tax=Bdellovibrio sp. BCCA TaxID=3136281 RepID=UPI0030F0F409
MDKIDSSTTSLSTTDYAHSFQRENLLIKLWINSFPSKNTQDVYSRYLKLFTITMKVQSLRDVRTSHINVYLRMMLATKSQKTVSLYKAVLGSAFSYLESVDYIQVNPIAKAMKVSVPKNGIYKIFSVENSKQIIDAAHAQDKAMMIFLYFTMARISELINLTMADIIVDTNWATIKIRGKGGKLRRVKIPIEVYCKAMDALYEERSKISNGVINPNDPLFISSRHTKLSRSQTWRRYKGVIKAAGLPSQIAPHWSRHSAVTHVLKRGASLKATSEMAGHESIEVTAWYQNIDDETPPSSYLSAGISD